jgi:hypothetical protein
MNQIIHPEADPRLPLSILMLGVTGVATRQPVLRSIPGDPWTESDRTTKAEIERAYEEPERWDGMS